MCSVEVDAVGVFGLDLRSPVKGDVLAVLEHVVDDVVAVMLAPAAQCGVGGGVYMTAGQRFLEGVDDLLVHRVFL